MRVLLMVSNSNIAVRQLYGQVLRDTFPGWGISNMSGLPPAAASIINSYDVLVYELGAADDPKRYRMLLDLSAAMKEYARVRFITHIEGPYRDGIVAELEANGIVCVGTPFSAETVAEAFRRVAPPPREAKGPDAAKDAGDRGLGNRLRGLFRRG